MERNGDPAGVSAGSALGATGTGLSAAQADRLHFAAQLEEEGDAFFANEEYSEARGCYLEALGVRESVLGPDSPLLAASLAGLAECAEAMFDRDAGGRYEQRGLEIMRQALGEGNWDEKDTFADLVEKYGDPHDHRHTRGS
jgi:hypothetical protein